MSTERSNHTSPSPEQDNLRLAFSENWLQVRHTDTQRFLLLNIHLAVVVGLASLLATNEKTRAGSVSFWLFLGFAVLSFVVFMVLLKLSADLSWQLRATQWLAEGMGLTKKTEERSSSPFVDQVMFTGAVGLPLPFPRFCGFSVTDAIFTLLPMFATSVAVGASAHYASSVFGWMSWMDGTWWKAVGIIMVVLVFLWFIRGLLGWIAEEIIKQRKPPWVEIAYQDEKTDAIRPGRPILFLYLDHLVAHWKTNLKRVVPSHK
jgi:hypothetical protein